MSNNLNVNNTDDLKPANEKEETVQVMVRPINSDFKIIKKDLIWVNPVYKLARTARCIRVMRAQNSVFYEEKKMEENRQTELQTTANTGLYFNYTKEFEEKFGNDKPTVEFVGNNADLKEIVVLMDYLKPLNERLREL